MIISRMVPFASIRVASRFACQYGVFFAMDESERRILLNDWHWELCVCWSTRHLLIYDRNLGYICSEDHVAKYFRMNRGVVDFKRQKVCSSRLFWTRLWCCLYAMANDLSTTTETITLEVNAQGTWHIHDIYIHIPFVHSHCLWRFFCKSFVYILCLHGCELVFLTATEMTNPIICQCSGFCDPHAKWTKVSFQDPTSIDLCSLGTELSSNPPLLCKGPGHLQFHMPDIVLYIMYIIYAYTILHIHEYNEKYIPVRVHFLYLDIGTDIGTYVDTFSCA